MSDLLYDEPPLTIPPTLAVAIGLKDAAVLQQLFWLGKYRSEGDRWIKKTLKEWQAAFPFFSEKDCQRIFDRLTAKGLVEVHQPGKTDRTKHYRVAYEGLKSLPRPSGQVDQMELVNFLGLASGQSDQMSNGIETEQQEKEKTGQKEDSSDGDRWQRVLADLSKSVPEHTFHSWLSRLELASRDGNTVKLRAPDEVATWARERYLKLIEQVAMCAFGPAVEIEILVSETEAAREAQKKLQRQRTQPRRRSA